MLVCPDLPLGNQGRRSAVFHDADANGSRSRPGKYNSGRSSSPYDDTQATDATMAHTNFHSPADAKTKMSNSFSSDSRTREAREKHHLARKPVPAVSGKQSQSETNTESSVEASRKVTNPVYGAAPVHL
jgi:hypothetical protein